MTSHVSTHSRSKAAASGLIEQSLPVLVSTHSRSKAATETEHASPQIVSVSTHSRSKAAAQKEGAPCISTKVFQLTAARRRLPV